MSIDRTAMLDRLQAMAARYDELLHALPDGSQSSAGGFYLCLSSARKG